MSSHLFLYLFSRSSRPYNITVNLMLAYHVYFVCLSWCMYVCIFYVCMYFSITSRKVCIICTCEYVKMISILIPFFVGGICVVSMPICMTANKDNSVVVVFCRVESSRVESKQDKSLKYNKCNKYNKYNII